MTKKTKPKGHGGARAGAGCKPSLDPTRTRRKPIRVSVSEESAQIAAAAEDGLSWGEFVRRSIALSMALRAVARGELAAVPAELWPCYHPVAG